MRARGSAGRAIQIGFIIGLLGLALFGAGIGFNLDSAARIQAACQGQVHCVSAEPPPESVLGDDCLLWGITFAVLGPLVGGIVALKRWRISRERTLEGNGWDPFS